jgi:two-component system, chemotaxis family, sensor kinase CheA
MGDGSVALILDVLGLAQCANVVDERTRSGDELGELVDAAGGADRDTVLVVDLGGEHRGAVALSTVARLEQIDRSLIEHSSRGPLVQYRGDILPLVPLAALAGFGSSFAFDADGGEPLDVVVWSGAGGQVGLVVERIVDIVEERIVPLVDAGTTASNSFVAVVGGHVTDVVDVASALGHRDPSPAPTPVVTHGGR